MKNEYMIECFTSSRLMYNTYKEIYERYLQESKDIARWNVLKTDAHNESWIYDVSIPIAPNLDCKSVYCLEIDREVIEKAKHYESDRIHFIEWDIRHIPFNDNTFDTIIDLSTIDHIPEEDINNVLNEYDRVLKEWWNMLLVVRLSTNPRQDGLQYYFNTDTFDSKVFLSIQYKETLFKINDTDLLTLYRLWK